MPAVRMETTIVTKTITKTLPKPTLDRLERLISSSLDSHKAENIVSINLVGKSDFADRMIIASGTSARHVSALADYVMDVLKNSGIKTIGVEGKEEGDWVLVDGGNIIIHIFKPDVRNLYNLEKMWSVSLPRAEAAL